MHRRAGVAGDDLDALGSQHARTVAVQPMTEPRVAVGADHVVEVDVQPRREISALDHELVGPAEQVARQRAYVPAEDAADEIH